MKAIACEAHEEMLFCSRTSPAARKFCTCSATERKGDPAESIAGPVASPCVTAYGPPGERKRASLTALRLALKAVGAFSVV